MYFHITTYASKTKWLYDHNRIDEFIRRFRSTLSFWPEGGATSPLPQKPCLEHDPARAFGDNTVREKRGALEKSYYLESCQRYEIDILAMRRQHVSALHYFFTRGLIK